MRNLNICLLMIFSLMFFSCEKFLSEKSEKTLKVPYTLEDLQSLLDNFTKINAIPGGSAEGSADNYYITSKTFNSLSYDRFRNLYVWGYQNVFDGTLNEWEANYTGIYYANTVLDIIQDIPVNDSNEREWRNLKGQAHFLRAYLHWRVANVWALAYDPMSSESDLGVIIRVTSDFNKPIKRSSLEETYQQTLADIHLAIEYLDVVPKHVSRASKPAAFGFMARVYLSMGMYEEAKIACDHYLQSKNELIDYNEVDGTAIYPFSQFNKEVVFWMGNTLPQLLLGNEYSIDSNLLLMYQEGDLRKDLFFRYNDDGTAVFRGSYEGTQNLFGGVATDEIYLIRAECNIRLKKVSEGLQDLNILLKTRWKTGGYENVRELNQENALNLLLDERRKSLLMRDLRWMDIKRLNKVGREIVLNRVINNQEYVLLPNDNRFALPLPELVIELSHVKQNPY